LEAYDKVYWHDAHHEALQLEFHEYEDALEFKKEHALSKEALRMDTLVIKKTKNVPIEKNIGKIFKTHNIIEYKSEKDHFDYWDYQKVLGYAFIYSSFEKVPMSDITISVSLTIYPKKLVKRLENERGFRVNDLGDGIYRIDGEVVPIQILESKNLSEDENLFLRNLRSGLSDRDIQKTVASYGEIRPLNVKNVYLDRMLRANYETYKEGMDMPDWMLDVALEVAEEKGILGNMFNARELEKAKQIAKNLLTLGLPPEKVAEAAELPMDTVMGLV